MKPLLPILAIATIASSVFGQTTPMYPSIAYSLSDISLYSPKNPERFALFSGEPQTLNWNNGRLELSKPVTIALNGFVVPRTLAVNGSNNLKLEIKPLVAFEGNFVNDQIQIRAKRNLQSVYYFDGSKWFTIARNVKIGEAAQFRPTPRASPFGAGLLSTDEALALSKYLAPQGSLLLATLTESDAPNERISLSPAPSVYKRSVLAVQFGVPRSTAAMPVVEPIPPAPTVVAPAPTTSSLIIPIVRTLETGGIAAYQKPESLTRFDDKQADFLETWKLVAGNQIPLPVAPKIDFTKSRVITIFTGQKPTGGYSVGYKSATLNGNTLKLVVETTAPAPGRIVTQVITSPFVMLQIENTDFNAVQVEFASR